MTVGLTTSPSDHDLQDMLGVFKRWLDKEVEPKVLELEHSDTYPTDVVEQMASFGLFGATIPAEYGGLGLSPIHQHLLVSEFEYWGVPGPDLTVTSVAPMISAVMVRRLACAIPIWSASSRMPAMSGMRPHLPSRTDQRASGEVNRKSAPRAIWRPPPRQLPPTAAMTGTGSLLQP